MVFGKNFNLLIVILARLNSVHTERKELDGKENSTRIAQTTWKHYKLQ